MNLILQLRSLLKEKRLPWSAHPLEEFHYHCHTETYWLVRAWVLLPAAWWEFIFREHQGYIIFWRKTSQSSELFKYNPFLSARNNLTTLSHFEPKLLPEWSKLKWKILTKLGLTCERNVIICETVNWLRICRFINWPNFYQTAKRLSAYSIL